MALRILALTNLYPNPTQPGRAPFNRQLFRALAEAYPLHVIAPIAWTNQLRDRSRSASARHATQAGITADYPRYIFPPKILRNWHGHFLLRSIQATFARAIDEFRPNVVFGSWAYPDGWAAVELGHRAGLPVVVKVHGSDINLLDEYPSKMRRTREVMTRADRVIAPSRALGRRVTELGADPARMHVIYNGVDSELFHPAPKSEARQRLRLPSASAILLFVGNLVPLKGIDSLIEACAQLSAAKSEVLCHLIGQGPMLRQLERQVLSLGLSQRVTFHRPKAHQDLPDWYRAADVFVLPSRSEGVPNVLLEAMACGTRFVATDVGGIPEIAHLGQGKLISPGNADSLADAIRETLEEGRAGVPASSPIPRSFRDTAAELAGVLESVAGISASRDLNCVDHPGVVGVASK